jgi:hypothetical protein
VIAALDSNPDTNTVACGGNGYFDASSCSATTATNDVVLSCTVSPVARSEGFLVDAEIDSEPAACECCHDVASETPCLVNPPVYRSCGTP